MVWLEVARGDRPLFRSDRSHRNHRSAVRPKRFEAQLRARRSGRTSLLGSLKCQRRRSIWIAGCVRNWSRTRVRLPN